MALEVDEAWVLAYCKRNGFKNPLEARGNPAPKVPKPSKYHNVRTTVDGIIFDSKREAERYGQLKLLLKAGEINGFVRQQPFELPGGVKYYADFVIFNRDGTYSVEDAKGDQTRVYINKRKQMLACLGIEIVEV